MAASAGLDLLALALRPKFFIRRRLEHVEFRDHSSVRRTVRLDLDLSRGPADAPGVSDEPSQQVFWREGLLLIPVAVLKKGSYTSYDVRDDTGKLLPRLTRAEERELLYEGLVKAAGLVLGHLEPGTKDAIHEITMSRTPIDLPQRLAACSQGSRIMGDAILMPFLELVAGYYLFVTLVDPSRVRQVLTYDSIGAVNDPVEPAGTRGRVGILRRAAGSPARVWLRTHRLWTQMGTDTISFDDLLSGAAASYHFEIEAPYDLEFHRAQLKTFVWKPVGDRDVVSSDRDRIPNLAHVHFSSAEAVHTSSRFSATLAHFPSGIVRSALWSAAFTSLVLAAGFIWCVLARKHELAPLDSGGGASILLLFPSVLGTLLVTPSSHSLTAKLVYDTRFMLAICSVMPWIAAISLAAGLHGRLNMWLWGLSGLVAITCTAFLAHQYRRLRTLVAHR